MVSWPGLFEKRGGGSTEKELVHKQIENDNPKNYPETYFVEI